MVRRIGCGPFDGGCLVFAQALQRVRGGDLFVVEGRTFCGWSAAGKPQYLGPVLAQHAVLGFQGGTFMDAFGRCEKRQMLLRTAHLTRFMASAIALRPLREGDLLEAARDDVFVDELAKVLAIAVRSPA
jgi:hypothetical protein